MKMISATTSFGALCGLLLLAGAQAADPNSPTGKWRTIDDKSGKPKSIVQITEDNGVLTGNNRGTAGRGHRENVQQV